MVLLKEVDREPYGVDAEASRTVIDEAFALCGPDGGITGEQEDELMRRPLTEGGQEAWDLIKRLRSRAWQKANLDPDIMWTREEVKRVARERLGSSDDGPRTAAASEEEDEEGEEGGEEEEATGNPQPKSGAHWQAEAPFLGQGTYPPPEPPPHDPTVPVEAHEADMTALLGASPGGPTPNIDWNEWDETFGESDLLGLDFGDINFEFHEGGGPAEGP